MKCQESSPAAETSALGLRGSLLAQGCSTPDWWGILIVVTAGKPWWLMTESVRKGYKASVYWAALGLYFLVAGLAFNVRPLLLGAASSLVAASLSLASAIALRRRERSRSQAGSQVGEGRSPQRRDHGERS